ncbi:MAG: alanine--glyoxylate aminotransferase family protein [Elusimicrobia bacterium]|jgi:aspartate aminotransferase-like enzyme|nr:alanine--glyoxylate aminotransferase family protein [Elusimicrobiota bacterium]
MKKQYLITPGPTPVPPEVALQSALPVLHHRTHEFGAMFQKAVDGMKRVYKTKEDILMISGSGTGAMEAAVANTLSPNDTMIVGAVGSFGERWIKIGEAFGAKVVPVREEWGKAVDPEKIRQALKEHPEAKGVFVQHTETSTGIVNDLVTLGKIVAETSAILVVDAISGLGGEELHMDDWKLDVVVAGSQKGLMLAPGLAFASVSSKGWDAVKTSKNPKFYFNFLQIRKSLADNETPWTPPVSLVAGLVAALDMIHKDGIENVWARHRRLAAMARAGMQGLGLSLLADRPCAVLTSGKLPASVDGKKVVNWIRDEHGVSVAGGQEKLAGKIVRLAHMGYMDSFDLIIGLTALEWGLKKFGMSVTPGKAVQAAQEAVAAA